MHAIRQYEFGGPEELRYEEVPDPQPAAGQVRIRVASAGVHLIDATIRQGEAGGPLPLPDLPMTPGREVAGIVDEVGHGVDASWLGRRAVAHLGQASSGYAELAIREVDAIHEIPDGVSDDEAVAMIGTGRTTLAVLEVAELQPTDIVLIPAAAGGIGALLVQAAVEADALAIGLAGGPAKVALVEQLGAQIAIDYTAPDWQEQLDRRLDDLTPTLLIDTVGGQLGTALAGLLRPGGRIVLAGWSSGTPTPLTSDDIIGGALTVTSAIGPRIMNRPGGLRELEEQSLAAVASRRLVPLINEPIALAEASRAHQAIVTRGTTGKVVLRP